MKMSFTVCIKTLVDLWEKRTVAMANMEISIS